MLSVCHSLWSVMPSKFILVKGWKTMNALESYGTGHLSREEQEIYIAESLGRKWQATSHYLSTKPDCAANMFLQYRYEICVRREVNNTNTLKHIRHKSAQQQMSLNPKYMEEAVKKIML